jgi:hypothetical protein
LIDQIINLGHYFIIVKHGDRWLKMDDNEVSEFKDFRSLDSLPYLLLYKLNSLPKENFISYSQFKPNFPGLESMPQKQTTICYYNCYTLNNLENITLNLSHQNVDFILVEYVYEEMIYLFKVDIKNTFIEFYFKVEKREIVQEYVSLLENISQNWR